MNDNLLDVLTREGVLINASVRYWRATKQLKAEELGLQADQVTDRLIKLGHKKLLPKEALAPLALIESRTHALIENSTFPFLGGLGHFVPNGKLDEVTGGLRGLEEEFDREADRFLNGYADIRANALSEWEAAAEKLGHDPEMLVAAISAAFPDVGKLRRSFGFTTQLFQIQVPESLELQLVTEAEQREVGRARQEAITRAAAQIRSGVQSFVGECVATLREQTATLCREMLESMNTGKSGVHQRTLNRLVNFIDQFKELNFVGDQEMETRLENIRREFLSRTAAEYRDNEFATGQLKTALNGLAETAREMATQDTRELVERFGQMGQRRFHLAA